LRSFVSAPDRFSATISTVRTRSANRFTHFLLLLAVCLPFTQLALHSQANPVRTESLEPGPQPADVSMEWKQLVGIYQRAKAHDVIILERDQQLFWLEDQRETVISPDPSTRSKFRLATHKEFMVERDAAGIIRGISTSGGQLTRSDAGADPKHFFHVTPREPLELLRSRALQASPPEETGPFRRPDLVELVTLDSAIQLDIRYAQSNNFLSTPVYSEARAFMQRPAAEALLRVLRHLEPLGYGLLIHDAYRPWYVTKIFWDATPPADHIFVADPQKGSKHNRGCAVDLTLYDLLTGQPIEMTGLYDEMSPRSFPTFPGGTSLERWHRDLLRRAMESEGFTVNEEEWWHFDYRDWKDYPILNTPFEKLGKG